MQSVEFSLTSWTEIVCSEILPRCDGVIGLKKKVIWFPCLGDTYRKKGQSHGYQNYPGDAIPGFRDYLASNWFKMSRELFCLLSTSDVQFDMVIDLQNYMDTRSLLLYRVQPKMWLGHERGCCTSRGEKLSPTKRCLACEIP